MQLVIMAGGLATRLGNLAKTTPKSMIPVCGKPMLERQIELVRQCDIREIVVCIGHLGNQIVEYFGDGRRWDVQIQYSEEGESLLGTGGALKKAAGLLDDAFMLMWGDSYLRLDYQDVWQSFERRKLAALMVIYKNENRGDTSNVSIQDGRVRLYDKWSGRSDLVYIDYGLSAWRRDLLQRIPNDTVFGVEELFRQLAEEGQLAAYEARERFYEIGSVDGLRELEAHLASGDV